MNIFGLLSGTWKTKRQIQHLKVHPSINDNSKKFQPSSSLHDFQAFPLIIFSRQPGWWVSLLACSCLLLLLWEGALGDSLSFSSPGLERFPKFHKTFYLDWMKRREWAVPFSWARVLHLIKRREWDEYQHLSLSACFLWMHYDQVPHTPALTTSP